jgi:tetratricopeptide (TPR) repeat protein
MDPTRNEALVTWMTDHGMTCRELAERVNTAIAEFTGSYGKLDERGIQRWVRGESTWPHERQRIALQRVTGCDALQLGFRPRGANALSLASPEEDPVHRRAFLAAASAAGAGLTAPAAATTPRRLGSSDVDRLNAKLAAVITMDDQFGGTPEIEHHAAALAQETLDLQQNGTASSRIRSELYSIAATFTTSAMWAAIDGRRLDDAQTHLNQAVTLSGLAGKGEVHFRVWGYASVLYQQLGRHADAVAASEASRSSSVSRRDPFYASLALARLASRRAYLGDTKGALSAVDHAQQAFSRSDPGERRPSWMGFFDQAELDGLALNANLGLGRWPEAEHHAHRSLALLRPGMERNRALVHAGLAIAQLGQGDIGQAVASASAVPRHMAQVGRIRKMLDDFTTGLNTCAADSQEAKTWADHRGDAV